MTDFEVLLLMMFMYLQGVLAGYLAWSPDSPFKRGLIDGLTLKFLWDWFKKK